MKRNQTKLVQDPLAADVSRLQYRSLLPIDQTVKKYAQDA